MILTIYSFALYACFWLTILLLEGRALEIPGSPDIGVSHYLLLALNILYILILPLFVVAVADFLFKKKLSRKLFFLFGAIISVFLYQIHLFLAIYRIKDWGIFDWLFFWFNRGEALLTVFRVYGIYAWLFFLGLPIVLGGAFLASVFGSRAVLIRSRRKKFFYGAVIALVFLNILALTFTPPALKGTLADFLATNFSAGRKIRDFYYQKYSQYLGGSNYDNLVFPEQLNGTLLGDNIFFVHLESVNSFLVNEQITPNLIEFSKQGIFFPKIYSNSVQTIRAQENLLCGLPPSLGNTIIRNHKQEEINKLACLPKILNQFGYKTLFFKADTLEFAQTGDFMLAIGFDEVHNEDIMQPGDPETGLGVPRRYFLSTSF